MTDIVFLQKLRVMLGQSMEATCNAANAKHPSTRAILYEHARTLQSDAIHEIDKRLVEAGETPGAPFQEIPRPYAQPDGINVGKVVDIHTTPESSAKITHLFKEDEPS